MFKLVLLIALLIVEFGLSIPARDFEHPVWTKEKSRNPRDYVKISQDTAILKPKAFKGPCHNDGLIWIFVTTAPGHHEARNNIRKTWGNTSHFNHDVFKAMHKDADGRYLDVDTSDSRVQVTFLVGTTDDQAIQFVILEEHKKYGDILQENFLDTYHNLTVKSLHIMKWSLLNLCVRKYRFVVKADDDVFLNVPNLSHVLMGGTIPQYGDLHKYYQGRVQEKLSEHERHNLIMGDVRDTVIPHKHPKDKYYVPSYMYVGDIYPKYTFGYVYVLSRYVIPLLLHAAHDTPIANLEDVYCTGMLVLKTNIKPKNHHLWSLQKLSSLCQRRGIIAENLDGAHLLPGIMESLLNYDHPCNISPRVQ